ncbi:MAG: hypothetical protein ABEI74_04905 [Candidatus Pacearchaeota archaeon]
MEIDPNKRYSLEEFLNFIEEPNGIRVRGFHEDYRGLIDVAKGSKTKHQVGKVAIEVIWKKV